MHRTSGSFFLLFFSRVLDMVKELELVVSLAFLLLQLQVNVSYFVCYTLQSFLNFKIFNSFGLEWHLSW